MKKNLSIIIALSLCLIAKADLLTDIVSGKYNAQTLPQFTMMDDGERYAQLNNGNIYAYSLKTGEVADTIFELNNTKGVRLESIEGFLLPPKGKFLLVYNNSKKVYRRSFTADWYIYNTQKKELKPLSEHSPQLCPQFSPNGRYIAFSYENNLYIHKLDYGTEVPVTTDGSFGKIINGTPDWLYEEEFTTTCLHTFSPDSKQLVFVRLDETNVPEFRWQDFLLGDYPQDYSLKYPKAGYDNAIASVVAYDIQYKSLKTINLGQEKAYIPRIRFADDDHLAVFCLNRNQNCLEMFMANPRSTVAELVYQEKSSTGYVDYEQIDEWQFLADNKMLVVNSSEGYRQAYLYTQAGQKLRRLTNGKYDVTCVYGYDAEKEILYFQAADFAPTIRSVYALNVKKKKTQLLTPSVGWHNATFTPTLSYFIDNFQSVSHANSYTLYSSNGKQVRELLSNADVERDFKALNLPEKKFMTIKTERGDLLHGWMLLPTNFDEHKQYPVLQVQYSGPSSQLARDFWKKDWEYFLASEGVIVVCFDPRGTAARGTKWRDMTYMNIGVKEAQDQVSVAKYMQSLSYVKKDKIAIWGWSYGGYNVLRSMSEKDAPYCCGISVAPVTDWRLYDSAYTERFMRRPQENESGYETASALNRAADIKGRLLLCHGLADDNVHCQQAWKMVEALVEAGIQFDMQIYPDDNHFLRKRNNYIHLYQRKWEFLKHYLLDEE